MASATPAATPEVVEIETLASPFTSRCLKITVGDNKIPFVVHHDMLAQTSFFEKETVKQEEAVENHELFLAEGDDSTEADYHLNDRFFATPAAFDIFVKFLYNKHPSPPTTFAQLTTLRQAYGLAIRYDHHTLQNRIIDCIRSYHAKTRVKLEELRWTCKRFGDNTECALNAYLVKQIAYEMVDEGYEQFMKDNPFMKDFWGEGHRKIRGALVEAIMNHTKHNPDTDPSTGRHKFHVFEQGPNAGQLK